MPAAGDHTAAYASSVHLAPGGYSDLTPRDRRVTSLIYFELNT
jgi:hypothetical protein